ncbi:hypothetical protein SAMN05192534_105119 [Alteribacillus persepolensis]|uniref:Uncharacterized protein n=1 Tax=Alteribacillus persepolensis TaxID=568899 RepID=A0A1G8CAV5_9BACI|nr:hypothetical protein SAMN05192534_105119 [Alteribacillus persepolensis]
MSKKENSKEVETAHTAGEAFEEKETDYYLLEVYN